MWSHHCHLGWHFWKRAPSVTQNPLCLMFPLPCAGGSSSAMCQRLAAESLEPKLPNSDLTWKLLARNGDSLVWGLFHMNLRAIWLAFFPERFFPFHTFPGTGAAEQPYNAGCLSWQFPKCCEQSMPGILLLNNHPSLLPLLNLPGLLFWKLEDFSYAEIRETSQTKPGLFDLSEELL